MNDHQFEMDYNARMMHRYASWLKELNVRLDSVDTHPLTRREVLDTKRLIAETVAEMRLTARDLETWQSEPKKKFWQFWK